jgi:endonuclease/exonuclease/phosphatase family metal-dependent hydrolase
VARTINESGADVIAVTEATEWPFRSRTQWQDVQQITRRGGYASPVIQRDLCKRLGCTYGPRLLIRSESVKQLDFGRRASAGYTRLDKIARGLRFDNDRQVTWAFLQGTDGSAPFLAVSVHLTNVKSAAGERHRLQFGRAATAWARGLTASRGLPDAPIILMGDLNSIDVRQPQGVQQVLRNSGWTDAIDAPQRVNVDINSINYSPLHPSGWSTMPIRHPRRLASRIDYIMSLGPVQPRTYEVVAHLNPDGSFDRRYQGSDHLLVRASLAFSG